MFSYELLNIPDNISLETTKIDAIFHHVSREVPLPQNGIINIACISDDKMQTLNREYREMDKTTDVLSFHYFDEFDTVKPDEIAGEIVLSASKITLQAEEHGHRREDETYILILHGLLHILGYDHETEEDYEAMWQYEKKIRDREGLSVL